MNYLHLQRRLRPGVRLRWRQLGAVGSYLQVWLALVGGRYGAYVHLGVGMGRSQGSLAICCGLDILLHQRCSLESERVFIVLACSLLEPDSLFADPDVSGSPV